MQAELFEVAKQPGGYRDIDMGDAGLRLWPEVFSGQEADRLFQLLLKTISWQQPSLRIAGQRRLIPRQQRWMGDTGLLYGYSGMRLEPVPWSTPVLEIKARVEERIHEPFNSVLLNLYRNGQDSVSWHADDETELGARPAIASVSLGSERVFEFKHKQHRSMPKRKILLPNGSLLLMKKGLQNSWLHQLPKVKNLHEPRINLTFRNIRPAS